MTTARPSARSLRAASAILRHSRTIIVVWVAVTAALVVIATGVRLDPDVIRLLPQDDAAQRLLDTYGQADKDLTYLIVMLRAPEPFSVSALQALEEADRAISAHPVIVAAVTPLTLPAYRFDGGILRLAPALPGGRAPTSPAEAELVQAAVRSAPEARNLVLAADGSALALVYDVDPIPDYRDFLKTMEPVFDGLREHYEVTFAGWVPLHQSMVEALRRDPPILGVLAVGVVILTLLAALGRLPVTLGGRRRGRKRRGLGDRTDDLDRRSARDHHAGRPDPRAGPDQFVRRAPGVPFRTWGPGTCSPPRRRSSGR